MATFWQNAFKPYFSPVIFLACSVGVAFLYLNTPMSEHTDERKSISIFSAGMFGVLSCLIFYSLNDIFTKITPSDIAAKSDIIPQINELVQRSMNGEMPYAPIQFQGYTLYPTYLPLQWLPYAIAEVSRMDYRWLSAIFLWLSCAYHFISSKPFLHSTVWNMIASLWPLIVWYIMIENDSQMFGITVESLVASYYLFTANAIKRNNIVLITAGLCLTLLSRYSIIFWMPCILVAVYMNKGGKVVLKMLVAIIVAFFIIYWLPFMRHDSQIFFKGYAYHSVAALGEWTPPYGQAWPVQLYNGIGMAPWGYRFLPIADLQQRLKLYQMIHIVLCLTLAAGAIWWYSKKRHDVSIKNFLLFSLKLSLVVFYSFIQIPYKYLFITPLIITAVLLADKFAVNRDTKLTLTRDK